MKTKGVEANAPKRAKSIRCYRVVSLAATWTIFLVASNIWRRIFKRDIRTRRVVVHFASNRFARRVLLFSYRRIGGFGVCETSASDGRYEETVEWIIFDFSHSEESKHTKNWKRSNNFWKKSKRERNWKSHLYCNKYEKEIWEAFWRERS